MSDSSGCVQSEIIPLSLSEGLWSPSLMGTKERKRAKKNSNKKRNYLDKTTSFFVSFCFFRSAYKLNHISNGA